MNVVKRKHFDIPSMLDDLLQTDWLGGTTHVQGVTTKTPAVNIVETDEDFKVDVAAPGIAKEAFNIALEKDVLTISAENKVEDTKTTEKYTRKEFNYSSFKRSFKLPVTVDKNNISASYEHGVLRVALPKREEDKVKPLRTIDIS